jgi:FSR family fosmidomycin resistance protein-like MFS transporter
VTTYAAGHGLLEFLCGYQLFAIAPTVLDVAVFLTTYNVCAFLLPAFVGLWSDTRVAPARLGTIGAVIVAVGLLTGPIPYLAAVLLGCGNCLFHVAAGAATLRNPGRPATAVGLFVAPGAIGLAAGIELARTGATLWAWPLVVSALAVGLASYFSGAHRVAHVTSHDLVQAPVGVGQAIQPHAVGAARPGGNGNPDGPTPPHNVPTLVPTETPRHSRMTWFYIALAALLLLAVTRNVLGTVAPAPWKVGPTALLLAAAAITVGKALGGLFGDRFGYVPTAVVSLAGAAILLPFFPASRPAALVGLALLNLSVPLILAALAAYIPGREGFAFGLGQALQFVSLFAVGTTWSPGLLGGALLACALAALVAFRPVTNSTHERQLHYVAP